MDYDRLNSPDTSAIMLEVLGHQLQFAQDPNSKHLGTTVWDASMVLVKFLEKNCRKGRFSPSKLRGKRVIELGAGCGVAGFGMALLGCDVISTDQIEVLPLLMKNAEHNSSRIMQMKSESDTFGSIKVAELNWGDENQIKAIEPPFDYIIGTDVVYAEHLLEPLLQTILGLAGPKTTILLGYEIRSTNVHDRMLDMWRSNFEVKIIPKAKMHHTYRHPSIQLYIMNLKPLEGRVESIKEAFDRCIKDDAHEEFKLGLEEGDGSSGVNEVDEGKTDETSSDLFTATDLKDSEPSEWEVRRCGAMAARLLRDIKIT